MEPLSLAYDVESRGKHTKPMVFAKTDALVFLIDFLHKVAILPLLAIGSGLSRR
jgi:hypothetical protein